jgi:hypothetical protein
MRVAASTRTKRREIAALAAAGRGAARGARTFWEVRAALRQARRYSSHPAPIRVCWDLDNTLVNSGALLRAGQSLRDAIVRAEPVPNMLDFFAALHSMLPDADRFILTARMRAWRRDTQTWLLRHGLAQTDAALCFVPYVDAKTRVWEQLGRNSRLVIVDDLSFNHERDVPSRNDALIELAQRLAVVYIGPDEIAAIAADAQAIEGTLSRVTSVLRADRRSERDAGNGSVIDGIAP